MSLNGLDIYQLTSGSTLPPTESHRMPDKIYMTDKQILEIKNFILPFVNRGDRGVWLYRMCLELGMLKKGPDKVDCSINSFYSVIRKAKRDLDIPTKRKQTIDLFKRMHPYCKKWWIQERLGLNEEQYLHLKKMYHVKDLIDNGQYTIAVNLDIKSSLIEHLNNDPLANDEIVKRALIDYFNKGEQK